MNISTFDPELFLQTTVEQAGSTQYILPDEGVYRAMIEPGGVQKPRVSQKDDETYYTLPVMWTLDDSDGRIKAKTGRDTNKVSQSVFLDINENGLDLTPGMNVPLGQLRAALGQNQDGVQWSPLMLENGVAFVNVKHDTGKDGVTRARVVSVAPLQPTNTAAAA